MEDSKTNLLAFLSQDREEEIVAMVSRINENEWEELLAAARRHKLGPILFHSLKPYYSVSNIPPKYQDLLRKIYFNSANRNMRLYSQLEEVLQKFAKEDIPVILLKGAYLAKYIYGNIALRPMSDIDLLVKHDNCEQVHRILIENGYSTRKEAGLHPYLKEGRIPLEIHTHLKSLPSVEHINETALWTRTKKVNLGKTEAMALCPEDLFLHLCLHNCIQHRFENGLVACIDTVYFLKHFEEKLNWEQLWIRAQDWGIERAVYLMLALTERMIRLPMPEQINQVVKPDQAALNALAEAEDLIFEPQPHIGKNLALLFGKVGWRKKIKILLNRIFLPNEIIKSDKKHLFYLSRLRSLYNSHRKTVWLGLRGNPQTVTAIETQNRRNSLSKWLTRAEES